MRTLLILALMAIVGCNSGNYDALSKVRWDFYKKNTAKYFLQQTDTTYFYKCDLKVSEIVLPDVNLTCFFGEFIKGKLSSKSSIGDNLMIPTVDIICYDKNFTLSRYYLMSNAYIDVGSQEKEKEEDADLIHVIRNNDVADFLSTYID